MLKEHLIVECIIHPLPLIQESPQLTKIILWTIEK